MDLQRYGRMKTALADILRDATMHPGLDRGEEAVRDLFARLAEDRFNLVVVGRFSRGKTSLMNAMLGADRLPTGIVPVTSVITTVTYGTEELVVLYYQHTSLFLEIPIAQLAEHITEYGNPGNIKRIRTAEVQLPAELLRRGFHFIDTPGLGSSIVENTRTTQAFLPEADACILVTSYDSPLSEEERQTLEAIHGSGRRIFLVVNKQDYASAAQRRQVLDHLRQQLQPIFGDAVPLLFSLSAQQALDARLQGDAAQLAASGLPTLEAALLGFLVNEKRREFLLGMCSRVAALLARQPDAEADHRRLAALRAEIEADDSTDGRAEMPAAPQTTISPTLPGCEICAQVADALFNFLARYQYQLSGNHQVQADLAARHGFCGPHTWQFQAIAAPKEICTGLTDVAEQQAAHLRAAAAKRPASSLACQAVQAARPTPRTCPACEVARHAAQRAVTTAAERLTRGGPTALRSLSAICQPHLGPLVAALRDPDLVQAVLLRQADVLERLSEDMRQFVLKRDGMQRHLTNKEEVAAGERTLRVLAGHFRAYMEPDALPTADQVVPPDASRP
jgi:small GTP-binding protein